mgnify:CR=1 FL=1
MSSHQALLFLHLFAVALASGVGFINLWGLRFAQKQSQEVLQGIAFQQLSLRKVGYVLVLTIVITGLWQIVNSGGATGVPGWFHTKMAFVVIWLSAYAAIRFYVNKMHKLKNKELGSRIRLLAHISWSSAAAAMFCAVMAFAS